MNSLIRVTRNLFHQRAALMIFAAVAVLAACSPRFNFREIRSVEGGFVVAMPDKPQTVSHDVEFQGQKLPMTMISTGVGRTLFAVGFARLPATAVATAAASEASIAWFRDALLRNFGAGTPTVTPARLILSAGDARSIRSAQAVEAVVPISPDADKKPAPSKIAARFFIVDDRFYQLVAAGDDADLPREISDTFFTSFRPLQ